MLVDGHGLAHTRRFGLACHLGVLGDVPTIGVAKSRLVGTCQEPSIERRVVGACRWGETIGAVLRTRSAVRPVFVSIGHRISLKTAIDLVLRCTGDFRLPEPIRVADTLSRQPGRMKGTVTMRARSRLDRNARNGPERCE